ncbi:hypothetical protein ACIQWR_32895 [Streptomyces sp. NPDC098789]|uniref:hypothetical protein n=1 Tax=Streptomyces sp. NPDC098789 TaxID=3366098 RepID=UPI0038252156
MTGPGGPLCARCDRTIEGPAETVTVDGGSGVRPDQHAHPYGDPACRPTTRGRWEQRLATDAARVLATVTPPAEAVAVGWVDHLTDRGGLLAHGVRCFHFQARGRRAPSADEALANWDAVVALDPTRSPAGHWGKALSLARVIRDLQREEDEHQARRRARAGGGPGLRRA